MEGKSAVEVMRGAGLEVDDVIATLEYPLALHYVDRERVAVGGVSLGGLVSVMAVAREPRFPTLILWSHTPFRNSKGFPIFMPEPVIFLTRRPG